MAAVTMVNKYQSVLTLDEYAVLEMTSPAQIEQPKAGETVIITTKDAYFWAVLFSELVSSGKDGDAEWFMKRFRAVLDEYRGLLRLQYSSLSTDPNENAAFDVFRETARACEMDPEDLLRRTDAAYKSLLDKKLIEDPFKKKIATIVLAVLGIVPTGASSTTKKGGEFVKEVHAITWDYKDTKNKEGTETKKVDVRLLKIIKILQPKILEAYEEIVMGDGGEETTAKK